MKGLFFLLVTLLCAQSYAASKCNDAELQVIDQQLGRETDVVKLHELFNHIERCDAMDGGISEGFDEAANKLLAENLPDLASSTALQDKRFKAIILKSISDGTETKTFDKIYKNARSCSETKAFCKDVLKACDKAEQTAKKIRESQKE